MDQVKVALAVLKKQHFWILCALIIIPSVVVWKMAVGHVSEQFDARKGEVEGHLSKVQGIKGDTEHPNQKTIADLKVQAGNLSEEVFGVWGELYRNQQKLNPWPQELGPTFINMVTALREDQDFPRKKFNEDYRMFIDNHLPSLDGIIDRRRPKELEIEESAKASSAMAMAMGSMATARSGLRGPLEYEGIVEWADSNRNSVRARFTWSATPSTAKVRVAQEDLWIYEAMLRVIAETNAGATGNFNAAVKRIEYLNIGQAAGGLSQGGSMYGGGSGMGGMGGMDMMDMGGMEMGGMEMGAMEEGSGSMGGGMASSAASEDTRLLGNRYVDQDGKPLGAGAAPPYAEFKMMPVKLGVVVDQGRISDLLVNCANCTMPIDVRRVSLWSKGGGASSFNVGGGYGRGTGMDMGGGMELDGMGMGGMGMGGMGMGGMGMGGMGMGGMGMNEDMGMEGYGGGVGSRGGATGTRREQITLVSQKDIPVEIEGIIYIFNKPARETMMTGTEEGATTPAPLDTEPSPTPAPPAPSETTPETAAPVGTPPPVVAPETTPAGPPAPPVNATPPAGPTAEATTPAAAGAGAAQPATTQPTAGEEPVTP